MILLSPRSLSGKFSFDYLNPGYSLSVDRRLPGSILILPSVAFFPSLTFCNLWFTNSYFVLSTFFVALGAVISQISWFRTTSASYSMFFVQIVSYWLGNLMARALPAKDVNLYFIKFNLNPAPFSIKEHVLITLA